MSVSGLTIAGAETRLRQELSQIMSTLSGSGEGNTFVSVSLSQIRSMKVNIVGEVVAPGTYIHYLHSPHYLMRCMPPVV